MACYRNILVALDGSPDAADALRHAVALARDQNALLTLLSVVPPPAGGVTAAGVDLTELHTQILREATDSVPRDVGVTTKLERGGAAEAILRVAVEGEHDLIVMGSHGHSRVHRALIGSVSERVLQTSTTPVLLMRGEGRGSEQQGPAESDGPGGSEPPYPDPPTL